MRITSGTDVETAPQFERSWSIAQRALQVGLLVFLIAGIAGVFGGGWLSTTTVAVGPFDVTYERFVRKSVPFRIKYILASRYNPIICNSLSAMI